jgi:polyisoprenyl-phosphate glycosyltransferase
VSNTLPDLSVIIPCYFNELNLPVTTQVLLDTEVQYPPGTHIEYVLVDDGSRDGTFGELLKFHYRVPTRVRVVKLAGNVGSYNAIVAGLQHARGRCSAVISADLQDPPELLPQMYGHWQAGEKLVVAHREARDDGFFNDLFSGVYQHLMRRYAIGNLPVGGFDVVLFDQKLRHEVLKMGEKNTNVLYLLPFMGYTPKAIAYTRQKRSIGQSRWTFQKKIKLLIDSFVAFSFLPIRMISVTGLALGLLAFLYACFLVVRRLLGIVEVQGWTMLMVVILFVSSFQMIALGILGEYVWRTLDAARNRPIYIVDQLVETREAP